MKKYQKEKKTSRNKLSFHGSDQAYSNISYRFFMFACSSSLTAKYNINEEKMSTFHFTLGVFNCFTMVAYQYIFSFVSIGIVQKRLFFILK